MAFTLADLNKTTLGNGLVHPLRRLGGSDFVTATGAALVKSALAQILGTRKGELKWRPGFGVNLERYRHRSISERHASAISTEIQSAIALWEPRISVSSVEITVEDSVIRVKLLWSLTTGRATPNNQIVAGPITTEVEV